MAPRRYPNFFDLAGECGNTLPFELWCLILSYLDFNSLLVLSAINYKTFRMRRNPNSVLYLRIWEHLDRTRLIKCSRRDDIAKWSLSQYHTRGYYSTKLIPNSPYCVRCNGECYYGQKQPYATFVYAKTEVPVGAVPILKRTLLTGNRWKLIHYVHSQMCKRYAKMERENLAYETRSLLNRLFTTRPSVNMINCDASPYHYYSCQVGNDRPEELELMSGKPYVDGAPFSTLELETLVHLFREGQSELRSFLADYGKRNGIDLQPASFMSKPAIPLTGIDFSEEFSSAFSRCPRVTNVKVESN